MNYINSARVIKAAASVEFLDISLMQHANFKTYFNFLHMFLASYIVVAYFYTQVVFSHTEILRPVTKRVQKC